METGGSIGQNLVETTIPARYRALWTTKIQAHKDSKKAENEFLFKNLEYSLIHKSGKEFSGETTIVPYQQDNITYYSCFIQDITSRKIAERQLQNNVLFLNSLLSNVDAGISVFNDANEILFLNQAFCTIRGISTPASEFIGKKAYDFGKTYLCHKDADAMQNRVEEMVQAKKMVKDEIIAGPNGSILERSYFPIEINSEETIHLIKVTDVTVKFKNEKLLKDSEMRSNLIMNASLNAIVTLDINEKISFWNHQAVALFERNRKEMFGKDISEILLPQQYTDPSTNEIKEFKKISDLKDLKKLIELKALTLSGKEIFIEINVTPIKVKNEIFYCASIQDITTRKELERFRKLEEEKYQNIIANMNLGLIEIDQQQKVKYVNQSFSNMSGYQSEELIGNQITDFLDVDENIAIVKSKLELRKQGRSDLYQIFLKNKKGEEKCWAVSGAPNYDSKGNYIGTIGIHLDITEQKQLEYDLQIEKTKVIESAKAKDDFFTNMSHEIRTPLNAVIGLLRELNKQELTELQQKYVNTSKMAARHVLALINNILDISKIDAGEMAMEKEDFIFEKIILNVLEILQPTIQQEDVSLTFSISNETEKVFKGDAIRLQQILFNLVGNAVKFTKKGSITIDCEVVNNKPSSQELKITISDTGIGMSSNFVDNIFNKFTQEDITITRKYGGSGLGLSITKKLVELMEGTIEVESEKNKGTIIQLYIDFEKGTLDNNQKLTNPTSVTRIDNISILLVEDNYLNRMVAQNSLSYYDCQVTEAENGLEAIALLKKEKFDIILMDIQMPGMDGLEATEIIRRELQLTTPIIAFTANAFKSELDKFKKVGMNDYVTKPYEEDVLIATIAKHTAHLNQVGTSQKAIATAIAANDTLYDLTSLKSLSRGNHEFVVKMMHIFIAQTRETIGKVTSAIEKNELDLVSQLIHKIKPSIETIGITSIKTEVRQLEKPSSATADKEQILKLFTTVKDVLERAIVQLIENELPN